MPEDLYAEIAANERQWAQWRHLGLWDGDGLGTLGELMAAPYRMVDTSLFSDEFKNNLLQVLVNIDECSNGLLANCDNFQGLYLLRQTYKDKVDCVYIDPPYNTDAAPIIYKNGFKVSTWNSLVDNRIIAGKPLMKPSSVLCVTIDDFQQKELSHILSKCFGADSILGTVVIRNNPSGRPVPTGFGIAHEYGIFVRNGSEVKIGKLKRTEEQNKRYKEVDAEGCFMWELLRKRGSNSRREDAPKSYFPFYLSSKGVRIPNMTWDTEKNQWSKFAPLQNGELALWPIDENGVERNWRWGLDTAQERLNELRITQKDGSLLVYYKFRQPDGVLPTTNWIASEYSATEHGTGLLKHYFTDYQAFSYPKSLYAVRDSLGISGAFLNTSALCLDYFAGSGTTGHAVINMNREDQGRRKYILIEQGDYFENVTKPRIQKVVYSAHWKDGKPASPDTGVSHCFKVLKLESYEDTLNNLQLRKPESSGDLFGTLPQAAQDDYLVRYMLDVESRGSLLSVEDFKKPFDYTLNIAVDSAGAFEPRKVDMVETFNYLIGLRVKAIDAQLDRGFVSVTGTLPSGERCLVLWRDCEKIDYDQLRREANRYELEAANNLFDVIYINGDHNIPASYTPTAGEEAAGWSNKIRQIEPEFLERMFSVEDI